MELFFLDTYALYELFASNPAYKKFEKGVAVITTRLNLMEFYYTLLRLRTENPDQYYDRLLKHTIEPSDNVIKKAMQFRLVNRSKDLSYVDAVGYVLAVENNAKFVTGDGQFKGMKNVEYRR